MTSSSHPIPTVGVADPLPSSSPLDLLVEAGNSPWITTIAVVAIGWRIISHLDTKIDGVRKDLEEKISHLDTKIDGVRQELGRQINDVRRELSQQINDRCLLKDPHP